MTITLKRLPEQVILITGASSGIGLVTARAAAARGAKVLLETPLAEHHRIFRTNYFGVVNGATTAVRHLREKGGALITVASVASDVPAPMLGAYAATKHAVKAFIETLRMELLADEAPVSVTLVKPSGIDTPFALHSANHAPGAAQIPKPVYAPELVAQAILDAAEHPRRDVTVGGAGRLQVLLATHFPALLDRMSRFLIGQACDPAVAPRERSTLFQPSGRHRAQSGSLEPRRVSLYTAARRHPATMAVGAAAVLAIAGMMLSQRRRRG
jgi:short-subunit dehydrogenase